ncbi:hypothetical protein P3T27_005475 [Kitasatospora sp. MAA19]|uniref:hypothetical protein n=1 Tax=unclassified Kitasatospora TaxID=2633591 RepID=UPI0024748142|nr:hypothetical protein [Kitasatospora sp. MAA19]MDH6708729.1 hypothetical protein [Kitasatospora sp. MAA19]
MATTEVYRDGDRPAVLTDARDGNGPGDEATARRLIADWLTGDAEPPATPSTGPARPAKALPAGWSVPPAAAREVVSTARRMALQGLAGRAWPAPGPDRLRLARVLVVDEHPSAPSWTERERADLAAWIALLVRRFGEDGVQRLTAALVARR